MASSSSVLQLQPQQQQAAKRLLAHVRLVAINDVYELTHLPKPQTFLTQISPPPAAVVLAGDFLSPSLLSSLDGGRGMVATLRAAGVTHYCLGNHEADLQWPVLHRRLRELNQPCFITNHWRNAIKFTPEEGSMTICTSWYPVERSKRTWDKYTLKDGSDTVLKRRGIILIQVIDSGVGLSEPQLKSLFKDGMQFDVNKLQGGQGSGLGLFISRGMAIQHGGDVKAASEGLGLGSTFTLQLLLYHIPNQQVAEDPLISCTDSTMSLPRDLKPLAPQVKSETTHSSQSSVPPPSPSQAAPGLPSDLSLRILVVDDVASNRKLISRMARNRNHHVDEAIDGRDAVEQVKVSIVENNPYDTILMDCVMPHQNGPDSVLEIRRMGCDSLIVGVTGNVLEEDIKHFISCGADSVLAKPVKFRALEEMWVERGNFE